MRLIVHTNLRLEPRASLLANGCTGRAGDVTPGMVELRRCTQGGIAYHGTGRCIAYHGTRVVYTRYSSHTRVVYTRYSSHTQVVYMPFSHTQVVYMPFSHTLGVYRACYTPQGVYRACYTHQGVR